jgi:hypothetical protein
MPRPIYNFAIDQSLLDALRAIKKRDGISESEQIRRGIRLWLKTKSVRVEEEADSRRAATRRQS